MPYHSQVHDKFKLRQLHNDSNFFSFHWNQDHPFIASRHMLQYLAISTTLITILIICVHL